jgi:DNA-binding response OmpR family regulator
VAPAKSAATRVLVVEDERDIADLVKHTLERGEGSIVEVVTSGEAALERATAAPPDLVILDVNLPVLSGFDVCRALRDRTATRQVPIIMLTARTAEQDRVTGLDLGADDTSPSRSPCANSPPACAPCCGAGARPRAPPSPCTGGAT